MKLNICLISYEYPPRVGGEAAYTSGLAAALSEKGHEVTVVTTSSGKNLTISNERDLKIIRLRVPWMLPKMFYFNIGARKLLKTQEIGKLDIIHNTSDYNGIVIPEHGSRIPVIATIHHPYLQEKRIYRANSNNDDYFKYTLNRNINYLEFNSRLMCKKADRLIAVSNYTAKSVMAEYGITSEKISVVPNAVDINKFNADIDGTEIRKRLDIGNEKIVLFVGRLDFQKGIDHLIHAFSEVIKNFPDVKLLVVGDGPFKNTIISIIKKYNLSKSIFLMGRASVEDLPKIYAASDILIVPSLMEGFGIVYLEAMACGKVCIGTNIGGVEDVIVDGLTGLLVPPADPESIYLAIKSLLSDEDTLMRFGKEGRKRVLENFTWEKVAAQTLDVYTKALRDV